MDVANEEDAWEEVGEGGATLPFPSPPPTSPPPGVSANGKFTPWKEDEGDIGTMLAPAPPPTTTPPPFPPRMAASAAAAAAAGSPRLSTIRLVLFTADTLVAAVDTDVIVMKLLRLVPLVPLLLLLLLPPLLLLLPVLSPPSALAPPTTPTPAVSSRDRRFDGDSEL